MESLDHSCHHRLQPEPNFLGHAEQSSQRAANGKNPTLALQSFIENLNMSLRPYGYVGEKKQKVPRSTWVYRSNCLAPSIPLHPIKNKTTMQTTSRQSLFALQTNRQPTKTSAKVTIREGGAGV